jgi:predicted nucleotidyltransferase
LTHLVDGGRALLKVERNSLIAGQKIKTVRDMLRKLAGGDYFKVEDVVRYLRKRLLSDHVDDLVKRGTIDPDMRRFYKEDDDLTNLRSRFGASVIKPIPDQTAAAEVLIDQLLKDGMIERCKDRRDQPTYRTTTKGNALTLTGFVPRMNRAKAEKLLKGALERVAAINARTDLVHWVTEVRVFGSYLTDTDDLGDLDLAIKLQPRLLDEKAKTGRDAFTEAGLELARRSGKRFGSFIHMLTYPQTLVRQMVKNRSPYISVHETDELDTNPHLGGKTIYTFVPPKPGG